MCYTTTVSTYKYFQSQISQCLGSLQSMLHKLFVRLIRYNKETTLAWLATLLNMNDSRINVVANTRPQPDTIQSTCTDGESVCSWFYQLVHLVHSYSILSISCPSVL